jgi:putative hydrolase of the HAD superfamily
VRVRAVIFDLWETLVDWPVDDSQAHKRALIERLAVDEDEFERRWHETDRVRETGPLAAAYGALGIPAEHLSTHVAERHEYTRRALRPRPGVTGTLDELARRGIKRGLISMCSEDVPAAWPDTELAARFEATTFSASCGLVKPDAQIYLRTARELGVDPAEALYVGDGANDELAGAAAVGLTPVLIVAEGREPFWPEVREWRGLRITTIPEVLELC